MQPNLKNQKSVFARRKKVEKMLGIKLPNIGYFSLDEAIAGTRHCENMIGVTQIPLGIAGPLQLKLTIRQHPQPTTYYIPLATTEGAIVASVNRGCKAITESGGVNTYVEEVGATRGPVFKVSSISEGLKLKKWLDDHFSDLAKVGEKTSRHLRLKKLGTRIVGKYVYIRLYFSTGEAMGMNMATIGATHICEYIEQKTKAVCISVAGNFDIDKKPAWLNVISGRGKRVWAEAVISSSVLKKVLKTDAQSIYQVWLGKNMLGSAMSGSLGFNAHFANVLAALFLATGQDVAHTVEGSMGITTTEIINKENLYISVYIPSLMIGTIGGGTSLGTQKEALSILGLKESLLSKDQFAQICAGAVLGGEISLLASLAEGSLSYAHQKLARGRVLKKLK